VAVDIGWLLGNRDTIQSPGISSVFDTSQGSRAQSGSVETLKKIINKLYSKHRSVVRYKYVFK